MCSLLPPQIQAWFELKQEMMEETETETWTNLNDLEEHFLLMNEQHSSRGAFQMAAY